MSDPTRIYNALRQAEVRQAEFEQRVREIAREEFARLTPSPVAPGTETGGEVTQELKHAYENIERLSTLKISSALRHGWETIADLEQRLAEAKSTYADMQRANVELFCGKAVAERARDDALARVETMTKRVEELETGLAPFAALLTEEVEEQVGVGTTYDFVLPVHVLRRARALLTPVQTPGGGDGQEPQR